MDVHIVYSERDSALIPLQENSFLGEGVGGSRGGGEWGGGRRRRVCGGVYCSLFGRHLITKSKPSTLKHNMPSFLMSRCDRYNTDCRSLGIITEHWSTESDSTEAMEGTE